LDECDRVVSHRIDGVRRHAGRAANAAVVEGDNAPPDGQGVDQSRIPVIEIPAEVLQQNERHLAGTEIVVRVLDAVFGRDSPDRRIGVTRLRIARRLVACGCHDGCLQCESRGRHRTNLRS